MDPLDRAILSHCVPQEHSIGLDKPPRPEHVHRQKQKKSYRKIQNKHKTKKTSLEDYIN